MKINNINNNCSFTSKIVVVDRNTFYNVLDCKKGNRADESFVTGKNVYTQGAATCIAGGVGNGEVGGVFHYCTPGGQQLEKIYNTIETLKTEHKTPNIFITGGECAFGDEFPYNLSEMFFNNVMEKINKFKKNISVIWGQKDDGSTDIHYSAKEDTWIVYHRERKINSLEDLKEAYEKIYIAEGDELWIGGKKIDNKIANSL